MSTPRRARPAWLREVRDAVDIPDAVERLWASEPSSPVIGPPVRSDGRDWCEVTFLWRQLRTDVEVMVHVNGLTDAMREDVTPALLEHVPGTDLWHLSWWLPADGTWGYRIVEMPEVPRDAGDSREGWLAIHRAGRLDPLNPAWQPHALGEASSLLVMPAAYQHHAWHPAPSTAQSLRHLEIEGPDGAARGVHLALPPQGEPEAVVVLLDGEQWAALGIADAVAETGLATDLLLVDSVDFPTRARDLPDPVRAAALVEAALVACERATGRPHDPLRTIVAGQSYGGLAAASTVLTRPDLARTAIAQSGSFWYRAGETPVRDNPHPGDLTRSLADGSLGSPPVRLLLHAGTDEGMMARQSRLLQESARAQGVPAELRVVTGGHDYAWWKHHLLRDLAAILPTLH